MKDFVMMTDHLSASHCDQQTLMEVLSEHVSLWGLRIKTFDADDTNFFPAGGHFHLKKDFMKDFVTGKLENDVYVFHMNWTGGKKEKMEYLMQMGQWYVKDTCKNEVLQVMLTSHSNLTNTLAANETIENTCCSKEALFSCHFRDKASIKPCKNSTAKFGESPSWW